MGVQSIGMPVRREEDFRLLRGKGRYVDDVREPNEGQGYVLRSLHAHARILALDVGRARAAPGVLCVLTGADLRRRGLGTLMPAVRRRRRSGSPAFVCPQPLLASERVRYVGDPLAFIVAESVNQAKDAAELIDIDYELLPAVIGAEAALAPGAPAVWDENPGNEAFFHEVGDRSAVDSAFAKADHIVHYKTVINRVTANSMEPRGCLAEYDPDQDRYTIRCTVQSVHGTRAALADRIFQLPHHQIRVVCDSMGGGFGMKGGCYPEYALSLWASEVIGRPVRWIAERSEGILSDEQGRGSVIDTELALDRDGRFLALRTRWQAAIGAYYSTDRPTIPLTVGLGCLVNTYRIPAVHAEVTAVLTNTMTIAPYRGGGRPEPIYATETIIDKAAHQLGLEPAELRRRNTIDAGAMPFRTALGQIYDCGDFPKNLQDCLSLADYESVAERQQAGRAALVATRLRRSPVGGRHRPAHHPAAARAPQPEHYGAVSADRHQQGVRYHQPAGVSARHRANRAGPRARLKHELRGPPRAGSGGRIPPLRPGVS